MFFSDKSFSICQLYVSQIKSYPQETYLSFHRDASVRHSADSNRLGHSDLLHSVRALHAGHCHLQCAAVIYAQPRWSTLGHQIERSMLDRDDWPHTDPLLWSALDHSSHENKTPAKLSDDFWPNALSNRNCCSPTSHQQLFTRLTLALTLLAPPVGQPIHQVLVSDGRQRCSQTDPLTVNTSDLCSVTPQCRHKLSHAVTTTMPADKTSTKALSRVTTAVQDFCPTARGYRTLPVAMRRSTDAAAAPAELKAPRNYWPGVFTWW